MEMDFDHIPGSPGSSPSGAAKADEMNYITPEQNSGELAPPSPEQEKTAITPANRVEQRLEELSFDPVETIVNVVREAQAASQTAALGEEFCEKRHLSKKDSLQLQLSGTKELLKYVASPRATENLEKVSGAPKFYIINESFSAPTDSYPHEKPAVHHRVSNIHKFTAFDGTKQVFDATATDQQGPKQA